MMVPTVHINGTSKDVLLEQLDNAVRKLHSAKDALINAYPHARDFVHQNTVQRRDAHKLAMHEHAERLRTVDQIIGELEEIHRQIDAQ
jgi:predicted exporter